ncbi:MAG: sugar phosphate isomerase/epimerase [Bacteroidales bacterium]|nr:sugar phosphate isomerase/epimerase [Bacteroidales bacterium]
MLKISAFSDEISPSLDIQLDFLTSEEVGWMEARIIDGKNITTLTEEEAVVLKTRLDAKGIAVSAIASPIGKSIITDPFEPVVEKLRHTISLCHILNVKNIRVFSFYPPEGESIEGYANEVIKRLSAMAKIAEDGGVKLVHENEVGIFGHSAQNCAKLAEAISSPAFSLAYDPANFVWGEGIVDNVTSCWPIMKDYVTHVHIKDWKVGSVDTGSLPGEGDGQIQMLIQELKNSGYSGFITLEPHMSSGGRFGGETSAKQFSAALEKVRYFINSQLNS